MSREEELEQQLQECRQAYDELMEELDQDPIAEMTVVGFDDEQPILLDNNGRRVKTSVHPEFREVMDGEDVSIGDNVWVQPNGLVVLESTGRRAKGIIGDIKRIRDGEALISSERGGEFWYPLEESLSEDEAAEVEPGHKAAILEDKTVVDVWEEPSRARVHDAPDTTYADVGGLEDQIETIRRKVEMPLQYAEGYEALGIRTSGGVMMYGPPGTGKTLLARATAGEAEATFFDVKISDILSKWFGESEANVTSLFQKARQNAPSVLFFDEFEAMGSTRQDGTSAGSRAAGNVVSAFLGELDGLEGREDVIVIGATNRIDMVDDAFLRPGRFDETIKVPPPDGPDVGMEIAEVHLPDELPFEDDPGEVRQEIVELTFEHAEQPTGAIIEGFCNETKVACVERCGNEPELGVDDVQTAIEQVIR